jgi:hypothetical protein
MTSGKLIKLFIIVSGLAVLVAAITISSIVEIEKAKFLENSKLVNSKPAADINSMVLVVHLSRSGNIDGTVMPYFF